MSQPPDPDAPAAAPPEGLAAAPPEGPAAAPPAAGAPEDLDAPEALDALVGMDSPEALAGAASPGAAAPEPSPPAGFSRRRPPPPNPLADPHTRPLLAAYVLLIGLVLTLGAGLPLALWLAWRRRADAPAWLAGHHVYVLRTIWTTAAAGLAGLITVPVGLGVFILTLTAVWCVVRAAAGLPRLVKGLPIDTPRTWSLP